MSAIKKQTKKQATIQKPMLVWSKVYTLKDMPKREIQILLMQIKGSLDTHTYTHRKMPKQGEASNWKNLGPNLHTVDTLKLLVNFLMGLGINHIVLQWCNKEYCFTPQMGVFAKTTSE